MLNLYSNHSMLFNTAEEDSKGNCSIDSCMIRLAIQIGDIT